MGSLLASEKTGERGFLYYFSRTVRGRFRRIFWIHEKAIRNILTIGRYVKWKYKETRYANENGDFSTWASGTYASFSSNRRGESFQSLSFQFRIGKATVGEIIIEVCDAIYHALKTEFLQTPNETAKWKESADLFHSRWNIPNNLGAIDGKRIVLQKPAHAGSHFHDYKGNESIITLVVAGPDYECLYVDVGTYGRNPDEHAWSRCSLKMELENPDNPLNIPADEPLPGSSKPVPFVLTGDEAFPLSEHMLKPYPNRNLSVEQRVANKRISRGRRISENLLGILVNRLRCFKVPFLLHPSKVKIITLAALSLHNWLRADASSRNVYCPPTLIDREDRWNYPRFMERQPWKAVTTQMMPGVCERSSPGGSLMVLSGILASTGANTFFVTAFLP